MTFFRKLRFRLFLFLRLVSHPAYYAYTSATRSSFPPKSCRLRCGETATKAVSPKEAVLRKPDVNGALRHGVFVLE
jgi:hypothetical protein